jgi:hypothetical protein
MRIPDYDNRAPGHYLGTEIDKNLICPLLS